MLIRKQGTLEIYRGAGARSGLPGLFLCLLLFALLPASASAAPPANDSFANAQTVGPFLPVAVAASNVEATAEPGEPSISSNPAISTVWFKWTALSSGTVVVDLCDAGFTGAQNPFEAFAVRTGPALNALSAVKEKSGECSTRFNAVLGTQYSIQVDYRNNQGDFTFRMRALSPPGNDSFALAQTIGPGLPVTATSSNLDSGWEAGEPALLGGSFNSRSVWFSWTSGMNGRVRLDICDFTTVVGPGNKAIGVYTGTDIATVVQVAGATSNCQLDFNTVLGQTYRIAFSGFLRGEGELVLRLTSAPLPVNDNFADPQIVGPDLPISVDGDNTFATKETDEPSHSGIPPAARSVWFRWTPETSARVRVDMCSKSFGGRLGVYTGAALNGLTPVGEAPPFSPHCRIPLDAVAGTTYQIAAAGGPQDNSSGPFTLRIRSERVPANDNFAAARRIRSTLPVVLGGTTVDAGYEEFEPRHDKYGSVSSGSIWYRWRSGPAARATVSACGMDEPLSVAVYTGGQLANLTRAAASDQGCPPGTPGGRVTFNAKRGTVYRIVVASQDRDFDSRFGLTMTAKYRFNLRRALQRCSRRKSKKARVRCARIVRRKAAVLRCRSKATPQTARRCLVAVKRRFS